jgi:hypothetical protein
MSGLETSVDAFLPRHRLNPSTILIRNCIIAPNPKNIPQTSRNKARRRAPCRLVAMAQYGHMSAHDLRVWKLLLAPLRRCSGCFS